MRPPRPHLVHVFSTFTEADPQVRTAALCNHFGASYRHTIVTLDRCFEARHLISPGLDVGVIGPAPWSPLPLQRLLRLKRQLRLLAPDLLLTYGWESLWLALVNRLAPLAPQIHHEDGFADDEINGQKLHRRVLRRLLLARVQALVVPSHQLEQIAQRSWRVRSERLARIPHGVEIGRFSRPARLAAIPGLERQPGELIIGTIAQMQRAENLERLLRVFARSLRQARARLIIVGEGPERTRAVRAIVRHELEGHVLLPGRLPAPEQFLAHFDVFASAADAAQMPLCILWAMAAGLPIIATDVDDVKDTVSEPNRGFVIEPRNEAAFTAKLDALLRDGQLRMRLGRANRIRAETDFPFAATADRFDRLYQRVLRARARH